jgi:hypothetical protein
MSDIAIMFVTVLLACVAAIAIYNWIRAELDERTWRRILEEEDSRLPMYRLVNVEGKDSDRE